VDEKVDEMVRRIVERFDPERIILFGSRARGEARPDSDVDLLVVMEVDGSRRDKAVEIGVALHNIRVAKEVVVVTPEEVRRFGDIVGTVIYPALHEGETLYARG
jgi:predicted nucleotidyltransferase